MKRVSMKKRLAGGAVAGAIVGLVGIVGAPSAFATQSQIITTPSDSLIASPNLLCSQVGAVTAQVTCTVAPASNQAVYVTAVYLDVCTNGTGSVQSQAAFNLTGPSGYAASAAVWSYSVAATANICQHWGDTGGGGNSVLMKTAPGVNFVVTSPAAITNNSYGIRVYGYLASP